MSGTERADGTRADWVRVAPEMWRMRAERDALAQLILLVPTRATVPAAPGDVGAAGLVCAVAGAAVLLLGYLLMIVVVTAGQLS